MTNSNDEWEYCQIDYKISTWMSLNRGDYNRKKLFWLQFHAQATEPNRRYIAARSEKFPHLSEIWAPQQENQEHQSALAGFVATLQTEDWELLADRGDAWWHKKLRRPLNSPKRQRSVFRKVVEFFS